MRRLRGRGWPTSARIEVNCSDWYLTSRPNGQIHHAGKEETSKRQDRVNQLLLGDQVHEIASDEKGFHGGNEERDCNIDGSMPEMNV